MPRKINLELAAKFDTLLPPEIKRGLRKLKEKEGDRIVSLATLRALTERAIIRALGP